MATKTHTPYPRFWRNVGSRPAGRGPGIVDSHEWPAGERPLRLVVVGKGGAGKSVIAGTMARMLARRGRKVLALDTDALPGMARSLGVEPPSIPPLIDAVDNVERGYWRLKRGIGPVRAVQRFSTGAPDGVRVLEVGDKPEGEGPSLTPAVQAFYQLMHALPQARGLKEWTMIGDLPAGPRQIAHDWAPYADTMLVVAEPSWKSALTARRVMEIARGRGDAVIPVANKVTGAEDIDLLEEILGHPVRVSVPADEAVAETDRRGVALIDHAPESPAARAIESLVEGLVDGTIKAVAER